MNAKCEGMHGSPILVFWPIILMLSVLCAALDSSETCQIVRDKHGAMTGKYCSGDYKIIIRDKHGAIIGKVDKK
jgi:hypothetical protein